MTQNRSRWINSELRISVKHKTTDAALPDGNDSTIYCWTDSKCTVRGEKVTNTQYTILLSKGGRQTLTGRLRFPTFAHDQKCHKNPEKWRSKHLRNAEKYALQNRAMLGATTHVDNDGTQPFSTFVFCLSVYKKSDVFNNTVRTSFKFIMSRTSSRSDIHCKRT
jgi:hypothetical protein